MLRAELSVRLEKADEKARRDAERILTDARRTAEDVFRDLDHIRKMEKERDSHHEANEARAALRRKLNLAEEEAREASKLPEEPKVSARPVEVGDTVEILSMGVKATVTAIAPNRTLTLRAGIMNVTAKESEVYLLPDQQKVKVVTSSGQAATLRSASAPSEIDLRGFERFEAVDAAERFIDAAVMAKLEEVRIIHGKGTGALRTAIQEMLKKNKAVKRFRLGKYGEGESGVTVVTLK